MTPVQIIRNMVEMSRTPDEIRPSDKLMNFIRINIASQVIQDQAQEAPGKDV